MLLTASEISLQSSYDWWFCLRAKPKREHIGAAYLRQNPGIEAFCPRVRFRKNTNREPVWFIESMFSGYLFAEQLINELKAHVGATELVEISQAFVPGQNVQVSQGPFQGLEALVTRFIVARDRVEILIEWMGRSLRAEADAADLLP